MLLGSPMQPYHPSFISMHLVIKSINYQHHLLLRSSFNSVILLRHFHPTIHVRLLASVRLEARSLGPQCTYVSPTFHIIRLVCEIHHQDSVASLGQDNSHTSIQLLEVRGAITTSITWNPHAPASRFIRPGGGSMSASPMRASPLPPT